jgi:hypothetical protein
MTLLSTAEEPAAPMTTMEVVESESERGRDAARALRAAVC